jgi:hypothetical protein
VRRAWPAPAQVLPLRAFLADAGARLGGGALIEQPAFVLWNMDAAWYPCKLTSYNRQTGEHQVHCAGPRIPNRPLGAPCACAMMP